MGLDFFSRGQASSRSASSRAGVGATAAAASAAARSGSASRFMTRSHELLPLAWTFCDYLANCAASVSSSLRRAVVRSSSSVPALPHAPGVTTRPRIVTAAQRAAQHKPRTAPNDMSDDAQGHPGVWPLRTADLPWSPGRAQPNSSK